MCVLHPELDAKSDKFVDVWSGGDRQNESMQSAPLIKTEWHMPADTWK